ncbi:MAG: hypothetical protein PHN51_06885 [Candidatus Nanopelagicales bacterium]|nr:hypothetical protein [Candidatus Nanopelagicales bacterium]
MALAPLIKAGQDPLLASRFLSGLALFGACLILYRESKRTYGSSSPGSTVTALLLPIFPATIPLVLIGMETIPGALGLLVAFVAASRFLSTNNYRWGLAFATSVILSGLLRPEALLIVPLVALFWLVIGARRKRSWWPECLVAGVLTGFFVPYIIWKLAYFGDIFPNPFYVKSVEGWGVDSAGAASVSTFISTYALLLGFAAFGVFSHVSTRPLACAKSQQRVDVQVIQAWLGLFLAVSYFLFFVRTKPLMDLEGRFLFPLVPIALLIASPVLDRTLAWVLEVKHRKILWATAPITLIFVLVANIPTSSLTRILTARSLDQAGSIMSKQIASNAELRVGLSLANYPSIKSVKIAFADSGLIPYYSHAKWLDVVGLNDSYIAKTKDKAKLIDCFFEQAPDLVLHPSDLGGSWITWGHGPLGDCLSWANDPRWDDYEYLGTVEGAAFGSYDLQVLVRSDSKFASTLRTYLNTSVVDGRFDSLPIALGTRQAASNAKWFPTK